MTERTSVAPHDWMPQRWRRWLCRHCYAPKTLHPRAGWTPARLLGDTRYLSKRSPHFTEGW